MLDDLIAESAAPEHAGAAVRRLVEADPEIGDRLASDPRLAATLVAVMAASRSLSDLLVTDPVAVDQLADLDRREPVGAGSAADLARWKRHELLRIAALDLTGAADLETTGRALARLAAEVLHGAVLITASVDLAIIGMGKMAGDELNYASDIDVVFVTDGNEVGAAEGARAVLDVARRCFRVDADLRPEGRHGPLVRTLSSYRTYWRRWAEPWEFQALLKTAAAAGPEDLGAAWIEAAADALWSRPFGEEGFGQLRELKVRAERLLERGGALGSDLKRGTGGIRDVEFAAQVLQLAYGRRDEKLRCPGTLAALAALAAGGYIAAADASDLADGYRLLRRVEHALQLVQERQTHQLPAEPAALRRLALVLGFADVDDFATRLTAARRRVRSIHERLYHRRRLHALNAASATGAASEEWLDLTGTDPAGRQTAAVLADSAAATPSPEQARPLVTRLLSRSDDGADLRTAMRDDPEIAHRLGLVAGSSRATAEVLLGDDPAGRLAALEGAASVDWSAGLRAALAARRSDADVAATRIAIKSVKDAGVAEIAAADLAGLIDVDETGRALGALADAVVAIGLEVVEPPLPFIVVALGRFGGGVLSYASDLDLLFAYDGGTSDDQRDAERTAKAFRSLLGPSGPNRTYEIDLNLRPEGRKGSLARSINGYRAYFEHWADPWERQAMLRARPVAGDTSTQRGFVLATAPFVWGKEPSDEDIEQIRHIKRRIENEKLPDGVEAHRHLKIGPGGLVDVEFTTELMQQRTGARGRGAAAALDNLVARHLIDPADAATLAAAYRSCLTLRNRLHLLGDGSPDVLPTGPGLEALATSLGRDPTELAAEHLELTAAAGGVVERLFYGTGAT